MGQTRAFAEYVRRLYQIAAATAHALWVVAARRVRRQPVEGPTLLREFFERLGATFVKFGQILSLQIDSLPRAYCDALLKLLDRVPPFSPLDVDETFVDDFGAPAARLYAEFDYDPIGSASIGQVHRAVLKDGRRVAVKVQRPKVRRKFEQDLRLMRAFMRLVFLFRVKHLYFMRDPVRELGTWTDDELDYRREAANCALLAENATQTPSERVPAVHWELTSARVLTMDFLEGPSVSEYLRIVEQSDEAKLAELKAHGFVPETFSANVISNFLSDSFRFGVFHADLHPANLLILANNVVGYVDFGIVATLTPEARRKQIALTLAYSQGDPQAIYDCFLDICEFGADADLPGLKRHIQQLASQWYQEPAIGGKVRFKVSVTQTMLDLLTVCREHGVLVDREMIKYIRSTILADGLVSRLAPGFDLAATLRKVVEGYLADEARQRFLSGGSIMSLVTDMAVWLEAGPSSMMHALGQIERGQLRMRARFNLSSDTSGRAGMQMAGAAGVWMIIVGGIGFGVGQAVWRNFWFGIVVSLFVTVWTLWLLRMLSRLAKK